MKQRNNKEINMRHSNVLKFSSETLPTPKCLSIFTLIKEPNKNKKLKNSLKRELDRKNGKILK